jgi:hypothetical protein
MTLIRTPYRGLRLACAFLDADMLRNEPELYAARRQALYDLNMRLGVRTVLDGCNAGHEQKYIDLVENWTDDGPPVAELK